MVDDGWLIIGYWFVYDMGWDGDGSGDGDKDGKMDRR